jgi:hypothetical protein
MIGRPQIQRNRPVLLLAFAAIGVPYHAKVSVLPKR